ncbi:MAG: hypothetical protein U5R49_25295 [Deltaproteobacteria bacterium]|nr:hypothetical protein [Deltaproteobacteria bacterium]
MIDRILNYDSDPSAIQLGQDMVGWVRAQQQKDGLAVFFKRANYLDSHEKTDLIVKIGILCGLDNPFAVDTLKKDFHDLKPGGKIVASSSNIHMKTEDPLGNFLLQNVGSRRKGKLYPFKGWPLNYRTKGVIIRLFEEAGFEDIEVSTEVDHKWLRLIPPDNLYKVDTLPALSRGIIHDGRPKVLPAKENLYRTGYNWIVVATK